MQISPRAPNYTDYIIITSSAIKGFSKSTSVLRGSARERLLYRRTSASVCVHHAHGGARWLGSSPAESGAPSPSLAWLPTSLCPPTSQARHPASRSRRSREDGLHQLGSCPEIPASRGIVRTTGHRHRLTQLPGRAFPRDPQRGGRTARSRGTCRRRTAPRHACSPKKASCNLF